METSPSRTAGSPVVTALLWLAFLAGSAVNSIGQFAGLEDSYRYLGGGVAVVCLVLLIVRFLARRKD
ncbi:hypothetical protein F9C11_12695 [Amycolatopsis sp. VS8301801F10]|uniref:hypothetical protein n=1 Tax=Amycolatopsis sp. VS8301801F10 TaxID=2652442 RepID=UPI0038FCADB4